MNVFLKARSLGSSLSGDFTIISNIGSVIPNSTNRSELLLGLIISVDNESTLLTISSNGLHNKSVTIPILPCGDGGNPTQTPTSTPTQTPTSTPTQTPTSTPTQTPTSTPTIYWIDENNWVDENNWTE
jgi:hypothetical protein